MWIAIQERPRSAAHPFYPRLNRILTKAASIDTSRDSISDSTRTTAGRHCRRALFPAAADGYFSIAGRATAVELATGAIVGVTVHDANDGDTTTRIETLIEAAEQSRYKRSKPRATASKKCR